MYTLLLLSCLAAPQAHDLETDTFRAQVDATGHFTSLVDPRDGVDYLPEGVPAPLVRIRVAGGYAEPESLRVEGERWTLGFAAGRSVTLQVEEKVTHLRFEVLSIEPPGGMELLMWGPYPTTLRRSIGETIGVVRGEAFAIGFQALNPKTLGGAAASEHDQMPSYNIFSGSDFADVEEGVQELYRGDAALRTEFGSTLQAYTRDRSKDRVIENWSHPRFVAPAFADGGIVGSALALFGCPVDDALATIGAIELTEGLPHPMLDGEWAKTSRAATASYLITGFGEDTVDEAIALTLRAGLGYLYHGGPFATWGTFQLNPVQFPGGWDGLKACVDKASAKGVQVGVHTLSNFITTSDPLVTPVPDPGLAVVGTTELSASVDAEATELVVADGAWFEKLGALRCARIGDELIQYGSVSGGQMLECKRGAFGTTPSAHDAGAAVSKLMDHGYRTFLTDAGLSQTVAERIAELFNHTGLRQLSLDGLEGNWSTGMGQYGRTLFASWWYEALKPALRGRVINDASNPGHYFWHIYTRMNWGEPWYAGFRESQTQYRLMNQRYFERNLMPRMLGWFKMIPATSLEDAEWLMARSAGFDAGFAFVTDSATVAKNGFGEEILGAIGTWEKARHAAAFPSELLPALQDISREFTLKKSGDGWDLREVYSMKGTHSRREQPGMPTRTAFELENPFGEQPIGFILRCEGKVAAEEIVLEINGREAELGVSLQPGQTLRWLGGPEMVLHDAAWQELVRFPVDQGQFQCPEGAFGAVVGCRFSGSGDPQLKIELRTIGHATQLSAR
ncbi:MAG: hypothetical protein ACJA2W_001535 [Planctomycetota bacterium]|jgi:hypothetical protein